jgi:hypothetical protein
VDPDTAADAPMTKRSERDLDLTAVALQRWLVGKLGAAAQPVVAGISAPSANGMSSESLMLDATWTDGDTRGTHQPARSLSSPAITSISNMRYWRKWPTLACPSRPPGGSSSTNR